MTDTLKQTKKVWVISDGVPGHFNQSKGVLFALQHLFELDVCWIDLKLNQGFLRRPLSWLLNSTLPDLNKLHYFYRGDVLPQQSPDIIVGAGGNTAYAVIWISKVLHAKSIFCGSLRHLNAKLFDAILVLEPDLAKPFISLDVSPMAIDQQVLAQQAEQWRNEHAVLTKPVWTMLIGGNGAGAIYQDSDWKILAEQMNQLAHQFDIRWLISTSRRTGGQAENILKQHLNDDIIIDAVWWSEAPRQVLHAFLGLSDRVYCGADSMSMMMETISAMRALVVYYPFEFNPDQRFGGVLQRIERTELATVQPISDLSNMDQDSENVLKPLKYEPSEKLAQLLKDRLFS